MLTATNWDDVEAAATTSEAVDLLQAKLDALTAACFLWRTTTKKDSDPHG